MPNAMSTAIGSYADAHSLAEAIAQRCDHATLHGDTWQVRCPAHDDQTPSLSITPTDDKILVHCFAGCPVESVLAALGLTAADLFVKQSPPRNGHRPIVKTYDYFDVNGTLVHQTVRYAHPKDFRQRRPDPAKPGEWIWNLKGIEPVLYHLPQVLDAVQREEPIYACEGEKDVDALQMQGLTGTSNPMGAGYWRESYSEALRGAHVVILPDNDEPGRKHAQLVANALSGIAASVKIVPIHTSEPASDVSDWLKAGGTREDLEAAVEKTPCYTEPTDDAQQRHDRVDSSSFTLSSLSSLSSHRMFPQISAEAFYGIAGRLRNLLSPHTEADDVAILVQFLAYFGVLIGRSAHYQVEATKHYTNLYGCLVGETSRARKGTSYDQIDNLMKTVDTSWTLNNISGGCGSGEGLIAAVRDALIKREPIKEKGRVVGYQDVEVDPGVIDKRLLVQEPEFAAVLKIAAREGNTLSMILRQAWDKGDLRNTVKTSPMQATGAHITVVGHITEAELRRYLSTDAMANGFGNRFTWFAVKRSKLLPEGGELHKVDFSDFLTRLREAVKAAKAIGRMTRDAEATAAWRAVYPELSADRPGLLGAMCARGEAQALRLSCLYALLESKSAIGINHLYAALAVWEYAEASVTYIFGDATGDPTIDTLLSALRDCYPKGLTRWQISDDVFGRHRSAEDIARALHFLREKGTIEIRENPSTGGRPSQTVFYRPGCEEREESEESPHRYLRLAHEAVEEYRSKQDVQVEREIFEV